MSHELEYNDINASSEMIHLLMRMPSLDAAMQRVNMIVQECISIYMYMWYLQLSGIMIQTS